MIVKKEYPDEMIEYIINIMVTEGNFNIAVLLFELTCRRFRNMNREKLTIVEESSKKKLSKLNYIPFFIKEAQSVYKNRKLFTNFILHFFIFFIHFSHFIHCFTPCFKRIRRNEFLL